MECGQYNERWHLIHMYPEEAVDAAMDALVKTAIPFHWAGFSLALHHWIEPVERFVTSAKLRDQLYMTPKMGQIIIMGQEETDPWWKSYE
jgi:L-ascorbate metabolism protein UlaG (beta-lactamase superfamily)